VKRDVEDELDRELARLDAAWEMEEHQYVHYTDDLVCSDEGPFEPCSRRKVEPSTSKCIGVGVASIAFSIAWIILARAYDAPVYAVILGGLFFVTSILNFVLEYKRAGEYEAKLQKYQQKRNHLINRVFSTEKLDTHS